MLTVTCRECGIELVGLLEYEMHARTHEGNHEDCDHGCLIGDPACPKAPPSTEELLRERHTHDEEVNAFLGLAYGG